MTEQVTDINTPEGSDIELRMRVDQLEHDKEEVRKQGEDRVIRAEMKVEALRAGIVDLDGLKFLDMTEIHLSDEGNLVGGAELIGHLKRSKPWLFAVPSSSSVARVPPSKPARIKLATEMNDDEYRLARENIIKRAML